MSKNHDRVIGIVPKDYDPLRERKETEARDADARQRDNDKRLKAIIAAMELIGNPDILKLSIEQKSNAFQTIWKRHNLLQAF